MSKETATVHSNVRLSSTDSPKPLTINQKGKEVLLLVRKVYLIRQKGDGHLARIFFDWEAKWALLRIVSGLVHRFGDLQLMEQ